MEHKKALLVVSFGTSYLDAIENCIQPVEDAMLAAAGPQYCLYRAFTSRMIMRKLEKVYDIHIPDPVKALNTLLQEGFREILVAPTHILAGEEYHQLASEVDTFSKANPECTVILGQPLLYENQDYEDTARALAGWMPKAGSDEAVVIMGHGTEHFSNSSYFALQHYLDQMNTHAVYVANVEAPPLLGERIRRLKEEHISRVWLMPFMLVAGDHAHNDMAGENEDSWNRILQNHGFSTEVILKGLGECQDFRELYAKKVQKALGK